VCKCLNAYVSGCARSLDVAFVLDLSSGDLDLIYRVSLPFIRLVADGLPLRPDRVRLALVTAVDSPAVQFYFNTYRYVHFSQTFAVPYLMPVSHRAYGQARTVNAYGHPQNLLPCWGPAAVSSLLASHRCLSFEC